MGIGGGRSGRDFKVQNFVLMHSILNTHWIFTNRDQVGMETERTHTMEYKLSEFNRIPLSITILGKVQMTYNRGNL